MFIQEKLAWENIYDNRVLGHLDCNSPTVGVVITQQGIKHGHADDYDV